jgi:hypothetical protein
VVRRAGLIVSTLNVVGNVTFDRFGAPEALATTIEGLASHMRWAAAMDAPSVLIWEGRVERRDDVDAACRTLAQVIEIAGRRSGLTSPPPVSCELHFPPGEGFSISMLSARLAGRPMALRWDLFDWPGPRHAVRSRISVYRAFVERHAASVRSH